MMIWVFIRLVVNRFLRIVVNFSVHFEVSKTKNVDQFCTNLTYEIDEEKYQSFAIRIATQQLVYNLTSHEITYKQLNTFNFTKPFVYDDANNTKFPFLLS